LAEPEAVRVLVVGGGPAGYTAALYAARFGLEPVCLEGFDAGGQVARAFLVENYPGAPDGISGADLAARIRTQAESFGARITMDDVVGVDLGRRPFLVHGHGGSYRAECLIVATGSTPRALGLPLEAELLGRGVAYCAICDGAFFAGQEVVVIGGGNAAFTEALAMHRVAGRVTLVHRRHGVRADTALRDAARAAGIRVLTPHVVTELLTEPAGDGGDALRGLRLRDVETGGTTELAAAGLFVSIGHEPASAVFAPWLATDQGRIRTGPDSTVTSLDGVFAAGDVADARYRQAVTAAASGCAAAIDAERWLLTCAARGRDGPAVRQPVAR
jgi:thioredoxin reductase (NADPH)